MEYIKYLPKNSLSRFTGKMAQLREPHWLITKAKSWFVERYKLNMDEAEHPLEHYPSLAELFARRLKPGARPLAEGIVHPCDAQLTQVGPIEKGHIVQTKGISYSVNNFLKNAKAAEIFRGGCYLTYYLCPTDYHRVHCPMDAKLTEITLVPGNLWPVNPWSVENISQLFAVNERLIFHLDTEVGKVALVMIGATNVGQIEVPFDKDIRTNIGRKGRSPLRKTYANPIELKKGDELGIFHMGSSVVLIFPEGAIPSLPEPGAVKMGLSLQKSF